MKSDDVEGRTKIYESMVKGTNTLEAGTPVSFDVLCNEIKGLGLNIKLEKKKGLGGQESDDDELADAGSGQPGDSGRPARHAGLRRVSLLRLSLTRRQRQQQITALRPERDGRVSPVANFDGAHEFFMRYRTGYRDFNQGDSFTGREKKKKKKPQGEPIDGDLDAGYYKFDLARYEAAYNGKTDRPMT